MESLRIFKIGGKVVENAQQLDRFLSEFSQIKGPKILVHGGGKWVTEMSQKLGISVKMLDGRRITDAETLEVVKMMLAGVANKNVVSLLQKYGCNAIGLTGADANSILATRRPVKNGIDYGFVGDVVRVNASMIQNLLGSHLVPVFAAMTHDGQGNMLNTNADTIAASLAVGLATLYAVELVYCFELNGVLGNLEDPDSVINFIDAGNYKSLKSEKIINEGMIPKIDNAFDALTKGVKTVRICSASAMQALANGDKNVGTVIKM